MLLLIPIYRYIYMYVVPSLPEVPIAAFLQSVQIYEHIVDSLKTV